MFNLQVPTDFSVVADPDLDTLEQQAREVASPLVARAKSKKDDDKLSDEERKTLNQLAEVVTKVRDEKQRRIAAASARSAEDAQTAASVAAFADGTGSGGNEEPGSVTASAPRVADVARHAPKNTGPKTGDGTGNEDAPRARLVAGTNLAAFNAGHQYESLAQVAKAAEAQFATFPVGSPGFIRNNVMQLQRNLPTELTITEQDNAEKMLQTLEYAGSEARLGQSLVAAAGWCAPSEIDYALFEIESADAGMLDLPTIQINRGGIQFTTGPDFSSIFGGAGYWHQTEAQVQAATTKPTMVVPCPSFTEKRLEVEGVAITGAFLQDRGYPEMVERFVRGALAAHARKLNIFKINQIVAGSTLYDYTSTANLPTTNPLYKDQTVLSRLLNIVGIQATDYRYKYRMDPQATLEAVFPLWLLEPIRADIQRRMGLDPSEAFNLAMSTVNEWLAVRGVRAQWIYDWQDAYNTTNTSTVGQTAGIFIMPNTVEFVLYSAGTWVAGVSPVVRLDTVYDAANLALNQYAKLFSEEGILVAKRGFESRRVKLGIVPSGATGATRDMSEG